MKKRELEYINIDELIFYERNARTHSDEQVEQIVNSIKEFGFTNPVLIDEDNVLIAGHGRTVAAKLLNMTEIPAIRLTGLSESQRKALRIADNQLALNAGWDEELLRIELEDLNVDDFDLSLIGFNFDELDELINAPELTYQDESDPVEEDEVPPPPEKPVSKQGDIWMLGNHKLMCGDSTSIDDVKKLMAGQMADLLITDPPYNVAYQGGTKDALQIKNDNLSDGEFGQFLKDAFYAGNTVIRDGAVFYIWHADSEGFNFHAACKNAGWKVRQSLIWVKNNFVLGRKDYQLKHEPCLYGWKDGAAHFWNSDRKQTSVMEFDKPLRNGEHPTMKPVALFDYLIKNNTKHGDVCLDLFGGSGTTIIACEQNGRVARSMELDEHYCDVIIKRWQELTGEQAVRDDGVAFNNLLEM